MGNGLSVTAYTCAGCGASVTRPPTKGQRPKWCATCRAKGVRQQRTIACALCGETCTTWRQGRFCSRDCAALAQIKPAKPKPPAQRSQLRRAWESEDWPAVLAALEARAVKIDGCWLWPAKNKDGYGVVNIAGRTYGVHRVAMAAHRGSLIPSHQPVHHKCAEALCFNTEHLQLVTPHENNAEMLERRHYQQRIAELEAALGAVAPNHPTLTPGAYPRSA